MASTQAEARDALLGLIKPAWDAAAPSGAPLYYDNLDAARPDPPRFFGRVTVRFQGSAGVAVGGGQWRRRGLVVVQVFTPHGSGVVERDAVVEALTRALEDPGAVENIRILDPGPEDIGSDGTYDQTNVKAGFQYDRLS